MKKKIKTGALLLGVLILLTGCKAGGLNGSETASGLHKEGEASTQLTTGFSPTVLSAVPEAADIKGMQIEENH